MKNRMTLLILVLLIALLSAACTPTTPQEQPQETEAKQTENLVWLYIQETVEGGFYGMDSEGKLWRVYGEYDAQWACSWVRYTGEPKQTDSADYEVTAESAWHQKSCDKADQGWAYDVTQCDIDGDGTEETCILTPSGTAPSCELTVWQGETVEYSAKFEVAGSMDAVAFTTVDGELSILGVDWPYGVENWTMVSYRVTLQEGRLTVSKRSDQ